MLIRTTQKAKDSSVKIKKSWLLKNFIFSVFICPLIVFMTASVASADTTTGLMGHWKLDETSGTTISDSSGNGRTGTASATTWVTGKKNGALKFDAVNDFANFGDILDAGSGDMTVAVWVKFGQLNQDQNIIGKRHSADPWYGWLFGISGNNMPYFCINNNLAELYCSGYYGSDISLGNWYHLVGVKSGNNLSFYVNGSNSTTRDDTVSGTVQNGDSELGFNTYPGWGNNFSGTLDDVRIYNRALTAADVSELYTGLVGHWKFDESSGTTAVDSSAEGNNGTVSGATWTTSGIIENALSFSGAGSVTKSGSAAVLKPSTEVSVSAWIKAGSTDTGGSEIVSMGDSYALRLETSGNIRFFYYNGSTWVSTVTSGVNLKNNLWHYVVAQKTSNSQEIYIDGILKITSTNTGTITYNQGTNFIIGKHGNGDTIYDFIGLIDDARVYNHPLTAQEIAVAYANTTSDLAAHWKFDEGSGTTITDSSGNGRNGIMNGATWTTGKIGGGLSFDGINDYINFGDILDSGSGDMTVTAWVKFGEFNATRPQKIVFKGHPVSPWLSWELLLWTTNEPIFQFANTSANYYSAGYWGGGLSLGTWYHIAGVKNGNNVSFYFNGTTTNTWSDTISGTVQNGNGALEVGNSWDGGNDVFKGAMDDIRVYNRALTAQEILNMYNLDNQSSSSSSSLSSSLGNFALPQNIGGESLCSPVSVNLFWTAPNGQVQSYNIENIGVWGPTNTINTDYADNAVAKDTYYIYDVTAVYSQGESAPASILVKTPSDQECQELDELTQNCPYSSDEANYKYALTFNDSLYRSSTVGSTISTNMSAGSYKVSLASIDTYPARVNKSQPNEQWYISLKNSSGNQIAKTASSTDLEDNVAYAYKQEVVNESLAVSNNVANVQAMWGGGWYPQSAGSLWGICGYFEKIDPATGLPYGSASGEVSIDSFIANPSMVDSGSTTVLSWTSSNADYCTASGGWSGLKSLSGSTTTLPIYGTTTFALKCVSEDRTSEALASVIVDINSSENEIESVNCQPSPQIANIGQDITWTANPEPPSGSYTYSWSGDDNLSGSSQTVTKSYSTTGTKTGIVDIGGAINSQQCTGTVRITASPSFDEF